MKFARNRRYYNKALAKALQHEMKHLAVGRRASSHRPQLFPFTRSPFEALDRCFSDWFLDTEPTTLVYTGDHICGIEIGQPAQNETNEHGRIGIGQVRQGSLSIGFWFAQLNPRPTVCKWTLLWSAAISPRWAALLPYDHLISMATT